MDQPQPPTITNLLDPSPAPEQSTHGLDILTDAIQGVAPPDFSLPDASSSSSFIPAPESDPQPLPPPMPLLNPLQTVEQPPSSTYAEPSRSPPPPPNLAPTLPSTPAPLAPVAAEEPPIPMVVEPSQPVVEAAASGPMEVDVPAVIPAAIDPLDGAFPTPQAQVFDPIPTIEEPAVAAEASGTSGGVKRAAPDDVVGQEEGPDLKRVKEDVPPSSSLTSLPSASSSSSSLAVPLPAQPLAPPIPGTYVPGSYAPPPRALPGLPTPLTTLQHRHLLSLLRAVKKLPQAPIFLHPVDPVASSIPHYPQYISQPMDLGTVETKLVVSNPGGKGKSGGAKWDETKGRYANVDEVVVDVRRIWDNTRIFNGPEHPVSKLADHLDEIWEKGLAKVPRNEPAPAKPSPTASPVPQPPRRPSADPSDRPKREIHPPAPKDLAWDPSSEHARRVSGGGGGGKRRSDAQLKWAQSAVAELAGGKHSDLNWVFLEPVDPVAAGAPDYFSVIKHPMDLGTIKKKLAAGVYEDAQEVNADVKQMFKNCYLYNPPPTNVHIMGQRLEDIWNTKWKGLPRKESVGARDGSEEDVDEAGWGEDDGAVEDEEINKLAAQIAELQRRMESLKRAKARKDNRKQKVQSSALVSSSKPSKTSLGGAAHHGQKGPGVKGTGGTNGKKKSSKVNGVNGHGVQKKRPAEYEEEEDDDEPEEEQAVTLDQKQELADKIQLAGNEVLGKAIQIIQETSTLGDNGEEIELDIDALEPATILKLYNLVVRGITEPDRKKSKNSGAKKNGTKKQGNTRRKVDDEAEQRRIDDMQKQLAMFEKDDQDSDGSEDYDEDE